MSSRPRWLRLVRSRKRRPPGGFRAARSVQRAGIGAVLFGSFGLLCGCAVSPAAARWSREFAPEVDIRTGELPTHMVMLDGQIVLDGPIDEIGGRVMHGIARWDGQAWQPFGDGQSAGGRSLVVWRDHLIVAGQESARGGRRSWAVSEWDGKEWIEVGDGLREASQLTVWNGRLVAAGGLVCAQHVFLLEGDHWAELRGLPPGAVISCLATRDRDLYAGTLEHGVLRWNGAAWVPHGPVPVGVMHGLWTTTEGLVAELGDRPGQVPVGRRLSVLATTGGSWLPLSVDEHTFPRVLGIWRGHLLLRNSDGSIQSKDGGRWKPLPLPFDGSARTVLGDGDRLWVLFERRAAPGLTLNQVAVWDGHVWKLLGGGQGVGGSVAAFHSEGSRLLVGGRFTHCGLVAAEDLALRNGDQWSAFDASGQLWTRDSTICHAEAIGSLVTWRGCLHAGGDFVSRGQHRVQPRGLARWDGNVWRPFGEITAWCKRHDNDEFGAKPIVHGLAVTSAGLAVVGRFCTSGGQVLNGIGLWDGNTCHPLGGVPGCEESTPFCVPEFRKVVPWGAGLIAAGTLRSSDGPRRIGWWNGREWDFMDQGTDGRVLDLMQWESRVVVAGSFRRAGDVFTHNIATWDGVRWNALGEGLPEKVVALGLYRDSLVAATSDSTLAFGQHRCALWTWAAGEWLPFMGGAIFEGEVSVLHEHQGDLYVGGRFGSVNTILSESIARWIPE